MKRLTAAIILGLSSLLFAVNPAVAQNDATVTARDVVDRESLKAFVLEAREYLDSFETLSGYRDALESFQGRRGVEAGLRLPLCRNHGWCRSLSRGRSGRLKLSRWLLPSASLNRGCTGRQHPSARPVA